MADVISDIKRHSLLQYIGGDAKRVGSGTFRLEHCPLPGCGHKDCFTIYDQTNTYFCYSCNKSGSIIDYVIDMGLAWDVKGAVELLAGHYNIALNTDYTEKHGKKDGVSKDIIDGINTQAAQFYNAQLMGNAGLTARKYLKDVRKRSEQIWIDQKYGYAGDRSALTKYLTGSKWRLDKPGKRGEWEERNYTTDELLATGLIRKDEKDGHLYDLFGNGQIIYPMYIGHKVCYFQAKPIDKTKTGTYQLPAENRLRNCLFYGQEAIYKDKLILVEGPEDRNAILECGDYNVAALVGFKTEQFEMIAERCQGKTVYTCFDYDAKGDSLTFKLALMAIGKMTIRVIDFDNKYKDIDEYLRGIPAPDKQAYMDGLLKTAKDVIIYMTEHLSEDISELDPSKQMRQLNPIIELIAKVEDALSRNQYMSTLAKRLGSKTEYLPGIRKSVQKKIHGDDDSDDEDDEQFRNIIKKGRMYYKASKENRDFIPISDFSISIQRYIEVEGVRHYEVTLNSSTGKSKPLTITNEQRINQREFDKVIAGLGSYYFFGNVSDLKRVWQIEEAEADIQSYTCEFRRFGYIKEHKTWLFRNAAYRGGKLYLPEEGQDVINVDNIGFKSRDVLVYGGDVPELNVTDKPTEEYCHKFIHWMWEVWDAPNSGKKPYRSFKGFMAAGFVAAVVYLVQICEREHKFPYILAFGPPGTGKSECMQFIMNCFGFRNGGENWGEATGAGLSQAMEQLASIPYWLEEFSNTMGASTAQQKKVELLKNIYNRVSSGKGGMNGKRLAPEVNAALFLTGQDRPENQALLSRCVVLRKEQPSEDGTRAYYALKSENKRLSLVLRWLLETKTRDTLKQYWDNFDELMLVLKNRIKAKTGGEYNERTAINYAIIAAAFSLYNFHEYDREFVNWLVDECVADMNRKQAEDIILKFIGSIELSFQEDIKQAIRKEHGPNGDEVYIYLELAYNEWVKNSRAVGMNECITINGLKDYLRKDPYGYWIEPTEKSGMHRKYFTIKHNNGGRQARCIGLYVDNLPEHIKHVVEGWDIEVDI